MELTERKAQLQTLLNAMQNWPQIRPELERMKAQMVMSLVTSDDEQLRGRIKQLNDILDLPATLFSELQGIQDALPD